MELATKRVEELKKFGIADANIYGDKLVDGTHVVYVFTEKPSVYDKLPTSPAVSVMTTPRRRNEESIISVVTVTIIFYQCLRSY